MRRLAPAVLAGTVISLLAVAGCGGGASPKFSGTAHLGRQYAIASRSGIVVVRDQHTLDGVWRDNVFPGEPPAVDFSSRTVYVGTISCFECLIEPRWTGRLAGQTLIVEVAQPAPTPGIGENGVGSPLAVAVEVPRSVADGERYVSFAFKGVVWSSTDPEVLATWRRGARP